MHIWQQSTGEWKFPDDSVGYGYSGHPPHVNDPAAQDIPNTGPIPQGEWNIGVPYTDSEKGPLVMALTPLTYPGPRFGFLIHGDLVGQVGKQMASDGCIVLERSLRQAIANSGDTGLLVIA